MTLYILVYTMSDMFLYEVTDQFQKEKLPFVIVGGYALALMGIIRATVDIDLVLHLKLEDYEKAEACLNKIGLQSRLPIRAQDVIKMRKEFIRDRNLIAWSFVDYKNPSRQVDILITKDIKELILEKVPVSGRKLPVASLQTLLKMKEESNRPQDRLDIARILEKINEKKT